MRIIIAIMFALLLSSCTAMDLASTLLPSATKGGVSAELQVGDDNVTVGDTGATEVKENNGTVTSNVQGLPPIYLIGVIGIFLLFILGLLYIVFQLGLRTPRPLRYTSEGRR